MKKHIIDELRHVDKSLNFVVRHLLFIEVLNKIDSGARFSVADNVLKEVDKATFDKQVWRNLDFFLDILNCPNSFILKNENSAQNYGKNSRLNFRNNY
jgi:hypothetical protein